MATTEHFYTGNNSTTSFAFTFPYLENSDVKVELDNVLKTENTSGQTDNDYSINSTNIVFNTAPASSVVIHIYRNTNVDSAQAIYAAGSSIRAVDLNNNQTQVLYSTQEAQSQVIRTSDIKEGAINSSKIENGSIVDADISTSAAITGTKVSPAFGSQNLSTTGTAATGALTVTGNIAVSGTVDGRDVAADGTKLDTVESNAKDDQTATEIKTLIANSPLDASHLAANSVNTSELADDAVTTAKIVDNGITTPKISDGQISTIKIADNAVTTPKIAATAVTDAKLASNSVTESKILDSSVTSTKLASGNVTLLKLHSDLRSTTISNSDVQLPTSGAVVDYVAAQIAPLGGLEVISNELSFPNTQPASGVVISISDAGGVVFNGSGSSTTGRTVGGSTVTINNAPSSLNSETLAAGVGLMVSSTGSGQIYNYHKILGKEDDIKQLSDDINDFNARYRVHAGEPSSNNDEGDLVFDTNANKMKVYDGSSWGEVTSTGEFKYLFLCPTGGSGAPTLNGSIATYDLREGSNSGSAAAVTIAAQLIVSINGVIQKANSGTSAPSEGFALVDNNTIIFGTNLNAGDEIFIVQIGSSVTIPTPGDGTVSAAKIGSGAVTTAKIADDAVTTAKIADNAVTTAKIADDAVTADKLANSINTAIAANTAKDLTALSASNLTSGTVPDARFPATLPAVSGANLTGISSAGQARNLLINGEFLIDQRRDGQTYSCDPSGGNPVYGTVDRWQFKNYYGEAGRYDVSQSTDTPNGNFKKSLKIDITTAMGTPSGNNYSSFAQNIEAQNVSHLGYGTSDSKQVTLQFWIKSTKTGTATVGLQRDDNGRRCLKTYTINASNTWEFKTLTFPADTSGGEIPHDNGKGLRVDFVLFSSMHDDTTGWHNGHHFASHSSQVNLADSTSNDIYFAGVQLEEGATANNFAHEDIGTTMIKCQRYYQSFAKQDYVFFASGVAYGTGTVYAVANFATEMRAEPSLESYGATSAGAYVYRCLRGGTSVYDNDIGNMNNGGKMSLTVSVAPSGLTTGEAVMVGFHAAPGGFNAKSRVAATSEL